MSYILEALKRAEQQRGAPARGAASLPRAIAIDLEPRTRWRWVVGGLASLAVVAGAIAFWPLQEPTVVTPQAPVAASATAVVAPAPAPPPAVVSAPPPAPAVARVLPPVEVAPPIPPRAERAPLRVVSAPPPSRAAAPRPGPIVKPAVPPAPVARSAAPPASSPAAEEGTASRAPSPVPSPAPHVEPSGAPTVVASAAPPVVARAAPPRVPSPEPAPVAAPAGDLKALTAKLSIQVLSWAPERKDRFVFLGGRKYGEGQMVDDRILIEQITEDGVVLSYQGERLTLKGR